MELSPWERNTKKASATGVSSSTNWQAVIHIGQRLHTARTRARTTSLSVRASDSHAGTRSMTGSPSSSRRWSASSGPCSSSRWTRSSRRTPPNLQQVTFFLNISTHDMDGFLAGEDLILDLTNLRKGHSSWKGTSLQKQIIPCLYF